jgi:DNA (cytosine-5)-methyltransferase 1
MKKFYVELTVSRSDRLELEIIAKDEEEVRDVIMTIGTVCTGIGAPEIAFDAEPLWFSEIEKFPSAVLAHHYPDVPNLGDFTSEEAQQYMVDNPPDVFMGGTPCQAFSVAGKRESLEDDRGNLTLGICGGVASTTISWNSVLPFGKTSQVSCPPKTTPSVAFSAGMVGAEHPITVNGRWTGAGMVSGQKGVVAWRTLDAQHWGVPQRRRRIFAVIGHPGDFSVAKILFEREGVFGDTPQGREEGQGSTRGIGASTYEASVYENHPHDSRVKGPLTVCEQLTARNGTGGGNLPLVHEESGCNWNGKHFSGTLTGGQRMPDKDNFQAVIESQNLVRRLTPVECERLQGFPDNFTRIPWRGKQAEDCPDGLRYKAIGNSMAVPCVRFISRGIQRETV